MKRETAATLKRRLTDDSVFIFKAEAQDILDSVARLKADLRRERRARRIGQDELAAKCACDPDVDYRCAPHRLILAALKPRRTKRSAKS